MLYRLFPQPQTTNNLAPELLNISYIFQYKPIKCVSLVPVVFL